jgi:hypothetical protein
MHAAVHNAAIGSPEHRAVLASFFLQSHVEYVPETTQWPELTEAARQRLAAMPFWQEAISTENRTSTKVVLAAQLEADPDIRKAIELQGFEEQRHARLLRELTRHYRIQVTTPPPYEPESLERDFLSAGFGECFDSFFAFGLFRLAQDSGLVPAELTAHFEPVIQEEARHILFFVNWVKYRRSQLGVWRGMGFRLRCGLLILKHVFSRIRTARSMSADTRDADNFTMSAHQNLGIDITLEQFLETCLRENERRLAPYDARLRRPQLVPRLARFVHRLLPAR